MGTRALTFVYGEDDDAIINLYRQFDGYPSGHGAELAEFLNSKTLVNGIGNKRSDIANGMGCLAAQLVANFKLEAGGFYLYPTAQNDLGQDYEYHVYQDRVVVNDCDSEVFSGDWSEFAEYCKVE